MLFSWFFSRPAAPNRAAGSLSGPDPVIPGSGGSRKRYAQARTYNDDLFGIDPALLHEPVHRQEYCRGCIQQRTSN